MSNAEIDLVIEHLVLEGFNPADQGVIRASLERTLGRLLAEHDWNNARSREVHIPRLQGGNIEVTPGASPTAIGEQIARAVFAGVVK